MCVREKGREGERGGGEETRGDERNRLWVRESGSRRLRETVPLQVKASVPCDVGRVTLSIDLYTQCHEQKGK